MMSDKISERTDADWLLNDLLLLFCTGLERITHGLLAVEEVKRGNGGPDVRRGKPPVQD
jgi:hypothetical protein